MSRCKREYDINKLHTTVKAQRYHSSTAKPQDFKKILRVTPKTLQIRSRASLHAVINRHIIIITTVTASTHRPSSRARETASSLSLTGIKVD
jgi:hypothetical protein